MTRPDTQLDVEVGDDLVGIVEFSRGANNFFDFGLIDAIAAACEELARTGRARAVVLCSRGRHRLVPAEQLRPAARAYAADIAAKAPIAVQPMRATLRAGLVDAVRAGAERRPARFLGR